MNEIMERIGEALSFPDSTAIVVTMHGENDWEVFFPDNDCSVRGTWNEIIEEIGEMMSDYEASKK